MLYEHLTQLLKELKVEGTLPRGQTAFDLEIEGVLVSITDAPPGMELFAVLDKLAEVENYEPLYRKLLRANFLGQATSRATLGLDEDGERVTLSLFVPTVRSYREFHDAIEDFVNAVSFWKEEVRA